MIDQLFGELRSVLARPPSEEVFVEVCALVEARDLPDEVLVYLADHLNRWPETITRRMPRPWAEEVLRGYGKRPAMRLCRDLIVERQWWCVTPRA